MHRSILMASVWVLSFYSLVARGAQPIRILELQGKATEIRGTKEIPLKVGAQILAGNLIRIQKDSAILVSLGHDVVAKIASDAEAKILEVEGKDWELNLKKGVTAVAVRNPENRRNHFQIRSRSAVMGVRGTVFYVESREQKPVFVCTCTGKVAIESLKGQLLQEVTATHHDHPLTLETTSESESIVPRPAPVGNGHSDADVEYLQKRLSEI